MQTPAADTGSAEQESNFWAAVPENEAVSVELERGGEGLAEIFIDRETCPTEFSFKMLVKKTYGGGKYRAVMRNPDTKQFMRTLSFSCGGVPKDPDADAVRPQAQESGIDRLAGLLIASQEASEKRMATLIETLKPKESGGMGETLGLIEKIAGILGKTGATPAPQKSLIEQFREFKEAAELLGLSGQAGADDGFSWVKELALEFGPQLVGAFKGKPDSGGEAGSEVDDDDAAAEGQMMLRLRNLLQGMVEAAKLKLPVNKVLERVQQQAGVSWAMLEEVIKRPDALTLAASMVPEVDEHKPWFEALRNAVMGVPELKQETKPAAKKAATKKPRKAA